MNKILLGIGLLSFSFFSFAQETNQTTNNYKTENQINDSWKNRYGVLHKSIVENLSGKLTSIENFKALEDRKANSRNLNYTPIENLLILGFELYSLNPKVKDYNIEVEKIFKQIVINQVLSMYDMNRFATPTGKADLMYKLNILDMYSLAIFKAGIEFKINNLINNGALKDKKEIIIEEAIEETKSLIRNDKIKYNVDWVRDFGDKSNSYIKNKTNTISDKDWDNVLIKSILLVKNYWNPELK